VKERFGGYTCRPRKDDRIQRVIANSKIEGRDVFSKRSDSNEKTIRTSDTTMEMETVRSGSKLTRTGEHLQTNRGQDDERMSLFWRVFGGTILSVAALVAITLYNNVTSSISELRAEISRLNEAKVEAAKKDDLTVLRNQVVTQPDFRREVDSLKERATKHRGELDELRKEFSGSMELTKRDWMNQIELLRKEQTTNNDVTKKEMTTVELVKDRLQTATAELKVTKDELQKLRTEMDKNQAYDFERRDRRDVQMKTLDELLKEMQKNLLEAREKIARLEGQQGPAKASESEPAQKSKTGGSAQSSDRN
jgi:hypothetical protein